MPVKALASGIAIVILLVMTVFFVELFIPLSVKIEMNIYCRSALMDMEIDGMLTTEKKQNLYDKLSVTGFTDITIESSEYAKYGEEINLHVEALYTYKRFTELLVRTDVTKEMIYDRTAVSRKVLN
jgi:hypothetical protein